MKKMVIILMLAFIPLIPAISQAKTHQVNINPGSWLSARRTVWNVLIDPGHGGPANGGGKRYNENGDYRGTYGYSNGLSEQWINLCVSFALRDSLQSLFKTVIMTRETQDSPELPPEGLQYRVNLGNYGNGGRPMDVCISVHFNGLPYGADQRTETWWSDYVFTDSGYAKTVDSKLAEKILHSQYYWMNNHYPDAWGDPCYECYKHGEVKKEGRGQNPKIFVLRNWTPPCCLTEPSSITYFSDEEYYLDDSLGGHQQIIAKAIFEGFLSWENGSGILTVMNMSIDGNDGFFYITGPEGVNTSFPSPFVTVAPEGTVWKIDFVSPQLIGGTPTKDYIFHIVEECDTVAFTESTQTITYTVPHCSTHNITAYYIGYWSYDVQLLSPKYGDEWQLGSSQTISWIADPGLDSTSLVSILLSRNGDAGPWDSLFVSIPYDTNSVADTGSVQWEVTGTSSADCRIRLILEDMVGNQTQRVSDYFIIGYDVSLLWPTESTIWQVGDSAVVNWSASSGSGGSTKIDILYSTNGGISWEEITNNLPNTGNYRFIVDSDTTNSARVKIMAYDSAGNTAEDVSPTFSVQYHLYVRWLAGEGMYFCMGWKLSLFIQFPPGSNGSSVATIYLSRDGGTTYEYLGNLPYPEDPNDYISRLFTWVVESPKTDNGRVYIIVTDDQGHTAEYYSTPFNICGGCVIGDLNKDSFYYDISDAVSMINYLLMIDPSICESDPTPCDIDCNGQLHIADFQWLVLIILGHRVPCDEPWSGSSKYAGAIEVGSSNDMISIKTDEDVGAVKFTFNEAVDPQLAIPDMQMKVSGNQVVVYSMSGHAISAGKKDILKLKRGANLLSVEAANCNGEVLKVISDETKPSASMLIQNFPNPFNPGTVLKYTLPKDVYVRLAIYNVLGQKVKTLVDEYKSVGTYTITWDGTNEYGHVVSSGIYFYRLVAGEKMVTRKMILMK